MGKWQLHTHAINILDIATKLKDMQHFNKEPAKEASGGLNGVLLSRKFVLM